MAVIRMNIPVRILTTTAIFDGHDAAINIIRRVLISLGAEIIHLGHNHSVLDIVNAAIQEDVNAIAVSSYQGGHMEFFKYLVDLLGEKQKMSFEVSLKGKGTFSKGKVSKGTLSKGSLSKDIVCNEPSKVSPILVFGGGGGTITRQEADILQHYGVTRIYTSEDRETLGLEGMANDVIKRCNDVKSDSITGSVNNNVDYYPSKSTNVEGKYVGDESDYHLAKQISLLEESCSQLKRQLQSQPIDQQDSNLLNLKERVMRNTKVIGITGTGGSGKSTLIDECLTVLLSNKKALRIAYLAIDPTRKKSGGALLGDRIRINNQYHPRLFMRSIATRYDYVSISPILEKLLMLLDTQGFDLILVETAGIGQSDSVITKYVDESCYVMTNDYGSPSQLEKIEMLSFADTIVLNKCDKRGSEDAYNEICHQWRINHNKMEWPNELVPVYPMIASQFANDGLERFINNLLYKVGISTDNKPIIATWNDDNEIIPVDKSNYLSEISSLSKKIDNNHQKQIDIISNLESYHRSLRDHGVSNVPELYIPYKNAYKNDEQADDSKDETGWLKDKYNKSIQSLDNDTLLLLKNWHHSQANSQANFQERENVNEMEMNVGMESITREELFTPHKSSLSNLSIPLTSVPHFHSESALLDYLLNENLPGEFPFTAGVFHHRGEIEEPMRMFAGEGTPEDTNRRFFYLMEGQKTIRLSTAFDPISLYGKDPKIQPDTYGCIGMSGVSIACIDDMKKLYSGIELSKKNTSVSMTINGPATIFLAWYFTVAIDQQVEIYLKNTGEWNTAEKRINHNLQEQYQPKYEGDMPRGNNGLGLGLLGISGKNLVDKTTYEKIKSDTLQNIRGTLQADILKEEMAQNECLFSLPFSLALMGDIQEYFINNKIKHYYSVSVSGYHIAEAGANPVTQLAFTLANGFTLVEYYLSRGMVIDDFSSQFSFFFSNGMDPEYAVIGRVARRIWARAMRYRYHANTKSQKLKYHIQTSGRSLQSEDIDLNDIRTTLQAVYAIYDNCNSLHTNAYDEAVTTPTEESVHRALAIQMIINRELGFNISQNPLQGSYFLNRLTNMVEHAVYEEFNRLSHRGGVLGAMETFYQRNKIQQESFYYESKVIGGSVPIIGVNTFKPNNVNSVEVKPVLVRSSENKKKQQINNINNFKDRNRQYSGPALKELINKIKDNKNSFECLMDISGYCSLEQMTDTLKVIGGEYRRKM